MAKMNDISYTLGDDGKIHVIVKEGRKIVSDVVKERDPGMKYQMRIERQKRQLKKEEANRRKKLAAERRKEREAEQKKMANNNTSSSKRNSKHQQKQITNGGNDPKLSNSSKNKDSKKESPIVKAGNLKAENRDRFVPQIVMLEWKDIWFLDRSIYFRYNNIRYEIPSDGARNAFNKIKQLFAERLPKIVIIILGKHASIHNTIEYYKVIKFLNVCQFIFHIQQENTPLIGGLHQFPSSWIEPLIPKDKSEYIDYLRMLQSKDERIIPVNESSINGIVDGFLFTIKIDETCFVLWESLVPQIARATYIFETTLDRIDLTHQLVFDYINSPVKNKRLNLWRNKVEEFTGIKVFHIEHDKLTDWKIQIANVIKPILSPVIPLEAEMTPSVSGKDVKNTGNVEYEIHSSITYSRTHNLIQNNCKAILESTNQYSKVILEEDNVDIKAFYTNGSVDYFEVKTEDVAQKNIRQAIGQIMEYAYYQSYRNVNKMYVVGPCKASDGDLSYLKLLREKHNLPIHYIHFNVETKMLVYQ